MYRNIVYNGKNKEVTLFTWDKDGNRKTEYHPCNPYYYIESSEESKITSIYGSNLKKHEFNTDYDRRSSIKNGGISRTYNNLPVTQQFLIDKFAYQVKFPSFGDMPLSIFYVDIEVYSPDEFPEAWESNHPINVISIYNSLKNELRVFCKDREFNPENLSEENQEGYKKITDNMSVVQTLHATEADLMSNFLEYWVEDYPDVITGWNLPFDIPYIVNRMIRLLPNKTYNKLSPTGWVRKRQIQKKISAQSSMPVDTYEFVGVTTLDYQDVFTKFNFTPLPNRKLDTVLEFVLGKGKVKYESSNLAKLSVDDWDLFVYYNIEDVHGIKLMEDRLNFLKIGRSLAYMGLVPLEKALDTLPIVNGYCAINSWEEGKAIPTFTKHNEWGKYSGGYVKEPEAGLYNNVVSFDLNSLYPMTMITLNCSPETKFGKVRFVENGNAIIRDNTGKDTTMTRENFDELMRVSKMAISKSNVLFTQHTQGIFPKMVSEVYELRLSLQKSIKHMKKQLECDELSPKDVMTIKEDIARRNVMQYAYKIFINSAYGYLGTPYAAMSDIDIAESITVTCQAVIQESCDILDRIVEKIIR